MKNIYLNNLDYSFIKKGEIYNVNNLTMEMDRMKDMYENHGYYNFDLSDIQFYVKKNSIENKKIDLYIKVKKSHNEKYKKFFFKEIIIRIDEEKNNPFFYNGYKFFVPSYMKNFNPKIITDLLIFSSGDLYKRKDVFQTKQNIYSLLYNFHLDHLKIDIDQKKNNEEISFLNVEFSLNTLKNHELKFSVENFLSKEKNIGILTGLTFLKRNVFNKGENFIFSIKEDMNFYKKKEFLNMNKFSLEGKFIYPYILFLSNFFKKKDSPFFCMPNSSLIFQIKSQKNMGVKKIIFSNILNFEWKIYPYKKHKIQIIGLQLVKNLQIFDKKSILNCKDRFLNKENIFHSYNAKKEKLIFMKNYFLNNSITYDYEINQTDFFDKKKKPVVLRVNGEIYGNFFQKKKNTNSSFFLKSDLFFKRSYFFTSYHTFLSKFFIRIAFTGNKKIPFLKNSFIEVNEDFPYFPYWKTSYYNKDFIEKNFFMERKILLTNEYRYNIFSNFISVLFLDMGNVWILDQKKNDSKIFGRNSFLKEFFLGGGIGFRYNLKFFIFCLDLSYKIYDPFQKKSNQWIFRSLKKQKKIIHFWVNSTIE
ncbi:POTRA domain-containing protein [Blattabacterium cuenoti]|uniref:POTRA domain-containing protein n=1 Tax=Blattabacterium cuenoti TaxID=1653831 RepID=UPI00163C5C90|nr:POTRA domain-containing protein [Blattabacterium cuenoti]